VIKASARLLFHRTLTPRLLAGLSFFILTCALVLPTLGCVKKGNNRAEELEAGPRDLVVTGNSAVHALTRRLLKDIAEPIFLYDRSSSVESDRLTSYQHRALSRAKVLVIWNDEIHAFLAKQYDPHQKQGGALLQMSPGTGESYYDWLDPTKASAAVDVLADELAQHFTGDVALIEENARFLRENLKVLDEELTKLFSKVPNEKVIADDRRLKSFLERYGLEIEHVMTEYPWRGETEQELMQFETLIRRNPGRLMVISEPHAFLPAPNATFELPTMVYIDPLRLGYTGDGHYTFQMMRNGSLLGGALLSRVDDQVSATAE